MKSVIGKKVTEKVRYRKKLQGRYGKGEECC